MKLLRWSGTVLGAGLLILLVIPSLAAWPSAVLDRGANGTVRVSIFPLALAAFDPFVWTCARNSVLVASATAALSLVLGVGLGSIAGGPRFWGRGLLWPLAIVPMAAGPLLIAPSLVSMIGGPSDSGWDWLASRSVFGLSMEVGARWLTLVGTGLASGVPLVGLATVAGLRQVDPAWSEAARAMGASRRQVWRDLIWPNLRPGVARASALVFTLALIEPAGPLILGLGRTLAVEIVRAATRFDQPTRSSTLTLLAILIVLVARSLIGWWGGTSHFRSERSDANPTTSLSFGRASLATFGLLGWCGLTLGPLGLWLGRCVRSSRASNPGFGLLTSWLSGGDGLIWVGNSVLTAGLAVAIDLMILRALRPSRLAQGSRSIGLACRLFEALPPLALGASALATPWLVRALADSVTVEGPLGPWLRRLALELSPGRSPGFLLILILAAVHLPMLAEAARLTRGLSRPSRVDASRLMGESDARASRAGGAGWFGLVPIGPAFLAFAMAATSLVPALLLTPFSERRTLAPSFLHMLSESGPIAPGLLGPVALLFGVNLLAFGLALRSRAGTLGI